MGKNQGRVVIDIYKCKGCGLCEANCPQKVLVVQQKINQAGYCYAQPILSTKCIGCASCAYICPDSCITVYKKNKTIPC